MLKMKHKILLIKFMSQFIKHNFVKFMIIVPLSALFHFSKSFNKTTIKFKIYFPHLNSHCTADILSILYQFLSRKSQEMKAMPEMTLSRSMPTRSNEFSLTSSVHILFRGECRSLICFQPVCTTIK